MPTQGQLIGARVVSLSLPEGLSIEELIIRRRIGTGVQGELWLGELRESSEPVAIKLGLTPGAISREAEVLSIMSGVPGFAGGMGGAFGAGHSRSD